MPGIPKLYWSGQEMKYKAMVIQLLGKDLAYFMKQYKKFSLKTVLILALQGFGLLESIHKKGVLHRDLKPENLILGIDDEFGMLYLIDFGISKFFRDADG